MFTTSWFRCEAEVRSSDLEYNRYDFFRTFTYDGVEYEYIEAIPIDLDNLRGYSGPGYNSFSNSFAVPDLISVLSDAGIRTLKPFKYTSRVLESKKLITTTSLAVPHWYVLVLISGRY